MTVDGIPVAILAAALTGSVSIAALAINSAIGAHKNRVNRQREIFSRAFASVVAYEEFAYVVRRRRASAPEDERIRISTELRKVQEDISYYTAWLSTESQKVSEAYEGLVTEMRKLAGREIHDAWATDPIETDVEMNLPDLGIGELRLQKKVYLDEVSAHLSILPRRRQQVK